MTPFAPGSPVFRVAARHRPFEIVAPGFVTAEDGCVGSCSDVVSTRQSPSAPFTAVELEVRDAAGSRVVLGLQADEGGHLLGFLDAAGATVGLELSHGGETILLAEEPFTPAGPVRLAFVLCELRATVLVDEGEGWRPLLTERRGVADRVDLRRPEVLGRYAAAWGVTTGTADLGAARAGAFGMAGLRDLHLVQHADGRPYLRDGRMFLTATCAGLGFFQQAHWAVLAVHPERLDHLELVAQLYTLRDGMVLGDHAGQVVRDDENDRWLVATSSWGDFDPERGVHVRHVTTTDDVMSGVHLLRTERTPLPTEQSSWDPAMTQIDGRWHVGFVESPSQRPFDFHPALAAGEPGAQWTEGLRLVGAATDLHQCEGPILGRMGAQWRLLASDGDRRAYPVFSLEMEHVGDLDAPYGSNIPHPQVVPLDDGWALVTFDGTQYAEDVLGYGGHGHVVVMRSVPPPSPLVRGVRRVRSRVPAGARRRLRRIVKRAT